MFGDNTSVGSYASNLLPSSIGSGGNPYGSSSTSSGTTSSGTTSSGTTSSGTTSSGTTPTEPPDPRMAWQPHVLPESVQFDSATIPLQSQLDNLFTVTPNGTESYTTLTVTQEQEIVTPTDEALGEGEKTENIKTSVIEKQEWTPAGDWVVTQTLRNDYTSTEDSTDADEIDTGINRTSWTEFSVMVINGTRSIVSFTSFDSFSYGESSEYDDSKPVDDDATANDTDVTGTDDDEDEKKLATDRGNFESSLSASSSISVTFQQAIIQNADGTSSLLLTLSRSTAANYAMAIGAGFEIEDSEGDQVSLEDKEEEEDEDQSDDIPATLVDTAAPEDADEDAPLGPKLPNPEHGGNGSNIAASSNLSLSDSLDESTGISVGAIIPTSGSLDDIPDADIFGSLSFAHNESSSGDVAQAFRFGSQVSQGLTEDESDTHSYFKVDFSGGAGGGSGLNFNIDSTFGEIPEELENLPGSQDDEIPEPILGSGANNGVDGEGGLDLGFGVSMNNHGNSSSSIKFSEKTRKSFTGGKQLVTKGIGSGSSSGSSTSFGVGLNDDGALTFSVSVTENSNHGTSIGTSEYQLTILPASQPGNVKTIELWDTNSFASIADVSVTLTIGISITGEVEVDVTADMSNSDFRTVIRNTETSETGPGFLSKTLTKFWIRKGQVVGKDADGNPIQKVIHVTGSRSESINAGGSNVHATDPEDNSTTILLDAFENMLDVAGMAPGVGIVPDLLAVALATARGKWATAAMSLAAAAPGLGQAVTAGKLASKGGKAIAHSADEVAAAVQALSKKSDDLAEKVAKACDDLGNCFIAGTQVVVARAVVGPELAGVVSGRTHSVPLQVADDESLDAYYATGALALGVGLTVKSRRKSESKNARRRRFGS